MSSRHHRPLDVSQLLAAGAERPFDDLVRVAMAVSKLPIGLFYVHRGDRGTLKARLGVAVNELDAHHAVVYDCLTTRRPVVVSDTHALDNGLYAGFHVGVKRVRAFTSVPVFAPDGDGELLGVLAVCDVRPCQLEIDITRELVRISRLLTDQVDARLKLAAARLASVEAEVLRAAHQRWIEGFSYNLRTTMGPLQSTLGLLDDRHALDPQAQRLLMIARQRADDLTCFAAASLADPGALDEPRGADVDRCELSQIVEFTVHRLQGLVDLTAYPIRLSIRDEGPIIADRARLGAALQTLLCEVLATVPPGGRLDIVQVEGEDGLHLTFAPRGAPPVDDDGVVVPLRATNDPAARLIRPDPWALFVATRILEAHNASVTRGEDARLAVRFAAEG